MIEITSQEDFEREVLQADGLVLVDLWAPWCRPCNMVTSEVEKLSNIKIAKVNVDDAIEVSSNLNIRSIPTILFYWKGKEIQRMIGAHSAGKYQEFIDTFMLP